MAAKGEALAKQFEAKAEEASTVLERLSDADWKKTTSAEKWTVGVVAHHMAGAHEAIAGIIKTVASGQSVPNFTMDMLHDMNAKHAKEHAQATKAETVALHKKSAAAAAAVLRGLSDADYAKSGTVIAGLPPMSAEQVVGGILLRHIEEHLGSIRATISYPAGRAKGPIGFVGALAALHLDTLARPGIAGVEPTSSFCFG